MIFGLEPADNLPENWTPLDAVAVVKCLDEDGDLTFFISATQTLSDWECFGLLELAARSQSDSVVKNLQASGEEDDDRDS